MGPNGVIGILGGTSEGRLLADFCRESGIPAAVSVATAYGEELLPVSPLLKVHVGRMEKEALLFWIREEGIIALADATHPYAREISENAVWACQQADIPYERLVRETGKGENGGNILRASTLEEAVQVLAELLEKDEGQKALITTGSKELAAYTQIPDYQERLYVRVLPSREGIDACLGLGWKGSHIIAMQGPFSRELNRAMLTSLGITCMVTKESGHAGGFFEKLAGAADAGCQVIVVGRPVKESGKDLEEMKLWMKEQLGAGADGSWTKAPKAKDSWMKESWDRPQSDAQKAEGKNVTVTLAGIGTGGIGQMTWEAICSILESDAILGARRMVESGLAVCRHFLPEERAKKAIFISYKPQEMISWLESHEEIRRPVILFSGDVGFYSGANGMWEAVLTQKGNLCCRLIPGISSLSAMSALVGRPWEKAEIISLHGRTLSGAEDWSLRDGRDRFLLLDGSESLHLLCEKLLEAGQQRARVLVGERLGHEDEKVTDGPPEEMLKREIHRLSCAWVIPSNA